MSKLYKQKKRKPINWTQIFCGPKNPGRTAKNKQKKLDIENSWGTLPAEVQPRPRKQCINFCTTSFFLFKFLILSTGLPRRPSPPKIASRWRYSLPIENLTAHYNSQFCVSFHFCFCREA